MTDPDENPTKEPNKTRSGADEMTEEERERKTSSPDPGYPAAGGGSMPDEGAAPGKLKEHPESI